MLGHHSKLERQNDDNTWFEIGEIVALTPPAFARDAIEVTHFGSKHKEFKAGLVDGGEMTAELYFSNPLASVQGKEDTNNHQHLVFRDFESGEPVKYRIVFQTSPETYWEFDCMVTSLAAVTPLNDKMTATVTFKLTSQPCFKSADEA